MIEINNPSQNMSINNNIKKDLLKEPGYDPVARILVLGIGGAGNNAINGMIESKVVGVEFIGINTDKQDLKFCKAPVKVAIGEKLTGGRGCGAMPEIGEGAANESKEQIRALFRETNNQKKADMVFITCGMGGGTGTGAAPIIASIAKDEGILTVGVVTKPFRFEGRRRMTNALNGINKLYPNVDTLITIPNDKLIELVDANESFKESFARADEILKQSIKGITDLINLPALVNLDFADVSTVMRGKGLAHIAIGEANGEDRVLNAIKKAIECPLLETTIDGATDLIVCMSGKVSLIDVDQAMREIEPKINPNANIIFGAREDDTYRDSVSITLIATGIRDTTNNNIQMPQMNQSMSYNKRPVATNMNMPTNDIFSTPSFDTTMNQPMDYNQSNINESYASKPMDDHQDKRGFASLFSKKNDKVDTPIESKVSTVDDIKENINVDLSKIEFQHKNNDSSSLLPNFITDSFKNKN